MHNPRHIKPTRLLTGLGLLVCLLLSLGSTRALAIDGNIKCTGPGTGGATNFTNIGPFQPGEQFKFSMIANCYVVRTFASGASLGHFQRYLKGTAESVQLFHTGSQKMVPLQDQGIVGPVCLPQTCVRLAADTVFQYEVIVVGTAGQYYGDYELALLLNDTMIGSPTYNDTLQQFYVQYSVAKPTCTLISGSNLNLPFGTLSSSDFATSQQIADIKINCPGATKATASLSSPQSSPTGGKDGSTYTTLPQLLMIATWADTNSIVDFTQSRTFAFSEGVNTVSLGFRPKLVSPDVTPTGNFSSQYTLNITYL